MYRLKGESRKQAIVNKDLFFILMMKVLTYRGDITNEKIEKIFNKMKKDYKEFKVVL